jgi:glycosyltransferase involved in cell wall biosynthesis
MTAVSVIIPTYNHAQFVGEAIESALEQTSKPTEVIVVDDGSTDGTSAIVNRYRDQIRVVRQENRGVSAARNVGAAVAAGDLLAFLDADDVWLPDKLERQAAQFEADPELGLIHCGVETIDAQGRQVDRVLDGMEGWVAEAMLQFRRPVILGGGSGVLIPRPVFEAAGGFDVRLSTSADWDLYYRIACHRRVGFVPEVLLRYRLHGDNMHGNIVRMEQDMLLAYRKAFEDAPPALRARRRRYYGSLHTVLAGSYYVTGHYGRFARHALLGIFLAPENLARHLAYPLRRWRRRAQRTDGATRRAALYICYYDVTEPLVQTQVVAYLKALASQGVEIHLLTFERVRHPAEERAAIERALAADGITWHHLRYHQRPSLPATLFDIGVGALTAIRLCRRHAIPLVHARSHVPAAMALVVQRVLGCAFLFDIRGLLAEEYVDAGHWRVGGLKYRLTKAMERVFFRKADAFVMLTQRIKDVLTATEPALRGRADQITVIPCCVDLDRFSITHEQRNAYRQERRWEARRVLTYVGKIGTWYLTGDMIGFFVALYRRDPRFFFQVLTQSDPEPLRAALVAAGVDPADFDIRYASPDRLPLILAASDAAISLIMASPSKRASSPTKVGECLAAGLPLVVNTGIGDCDRQVEDHQLGVVLSALTPAEFERGAERLCVLLDSAGTAQRCRAFAESILSLSQVGRPRYSEIYERLLRLRPTTKSRFTVAETPEAVATRG